MSEDAPRISVSRDALRADLAEMELRLRTYFDAQLANKASAADLLRIADRLNGLDRGDWSPSYSRAVDERVAQLMGKKEDQGWSSRERAFALVSAIVTVLTFAMSAFIAARGGGV